MIPEINFPDESRLLARKRKIYAIIERDAKASNSQLTFKIALGLITGFLIVVAIILSIAWFYPPEWESNPFVGWFIIAVGLGVYMIKRK